MLIILLLSAVSNCSSANSKNDSSEKRFRLEEEMRVGTMDGELEYLLGNIRNIEIGENGVMFVSDNQVPVLRMYNKDGIFIKNIGREGRGPGEYLEIGGMGMFPDGRLAVWDQRNGRVNIYNETGEFLKARLFNGGIFADEVFKVGNDGYLYFRGIFSNTITNRQPREYWLKVSEEGEVMNTLAFPKPMNTNELSFVIFTSNGNAFPFAEEQITALSVEGYLISGLNSDYDLEFIHTRTQKENITRAHETVSIPSEERSQWRKFKQRFPMSTVTIPDEKPVYKKIFADADSRIWVWRYTEAKLTDKVSSNIAVENGWWEQPTFDIFLESGEFYGTVEFPWNTKFMEAKSNKVWTLQTGEKEEQYIVRYRLVENDE